MDVSNRLRELIARVRRLNDSGSAVQTGNKCDTFAAFLAQRAASELELSRSFQHEVMPSPLAVNEDNDEQLASPAVRSAETAALTSSFQRFGAWARPEIRVELGTDIIFSIF